MIGILIVTHGAAGEEMLATASLMLGARPPRVATLGVGRDDDPDRLLARGRELIAQLDDGAGVLVLADMFGATPCNIAARLLADGRVEGVSGLSLPMLVRALAGRDGTLANSVGRALSGGTQGVLHINRDRCRDAEC
jgi:PTS system ascorbate-specific IIA component